ncbi:MAG: DUF4139 domain-containing protein [Synergistetes bacterium]|nr:DUF4139 domain-containing protein [Synergistota bacterium]
MKIEIYPQGAIIKEEMNVPPKVSELKIEIPYNVSLESFKVIPEGFSVDSLSFTNIYLSDDEVPAIKEIKDKIRELEEEKGKALSKRKGAELSFELLKIMLSKVQMDSPSDAHAWMSLIEDRTTRYLNEVEGIDKKVKEIDLKINLLKEKLKDIDTPDSRRRIVAFLKLSGNDRGGKLTYSYYSSQAGWAPSYRFALKPADKKVDIEVYANIWQRTGKDWTESEVTLSSIREGLSLVPPKEQNLIVDIVKKESVKKPAMMKMMAPTAALPQEEKVAFKEEELGVKVSINQVISVPSTGERKRVLIWRGSIPIRESFYLCRSYLDTSVYRMISLKLSSPFDFLPGQTELFVGETFIGGSEIEGMSRDGVYEICFGSDERVEVERKTTKLGETAKGIIDKSSVREYAYELKIKNLTKEGIDLLLEEVFPISMDSRIKVELLKVEPKEKEKTETGHLKWRLKLDAGEERKIIFSYRIIYPQEEDIELSWR